MLLDLLVSKLVYSSNRPEEFWREVECRPFAMSTVLTLTHARIPDPDQRDDAALH